MQAKLQERVNSHADQVIKMKLIFDNFDEDHNGEVAYEEFNRGLELLNVQLSQAQNLALFAFFDVNYSGRIDFDEFARYACLPNPKGGTAIYPKPITTNARDHADRIKVESRDIDEVAESKAEIESKLFDEQLRPEPDDILDLKADTETHDVFKKLSHMHLLPGAADDGKVLKSKAFSGAQWDDGGTFGTLVTQFVGDLQALVIRACLMANVLFFALGVYTGPEPTRIVAKGDLDMSAGAADQFE